MQRNKRIGNSARRAYAGRAGYEAGDRPGGSADSGRGWSGWTERPGDEGCRVVVRGAVPFAHGLPELLAWTAEEGFGESIAGLERAPVESDPRGRIVEIGLRYVGFGVQNPDLYRVLFSHRLARPLKFFDEMFQAGEIPHSSSEAYSRLAAIKMTAFEALVKPIREAQTAGNFA